MFVQENPHFHRGSLFSAWDQINWLLRIIQTFLLSSAVLLAIFLLNHWEFSWLRQLADLLWWYPSQWIHKPPHTKQSQRLSCKHRNMFYVIFYALAEALCADQINPNILATLVSSIACAFSLGCFRWGGRG